MAKTIKFNLICDGQPVRTLEDLRHNFSIEDVLTYYDNRLLHRWLSVRGYKDELEKVEKIHNTNTIQLIKELISVFDIESDPVTMTENTYILQYRNEAKLLLEKYNELDFKLSTILFEYHEGYKELINTIVRNKDDFAKIKAAIKEISDHYFYLYELDYRNIFYIFFERAPLAIFAMLMNEKMRSNYLPQDDPLNEEYDIDGKILDKQSMYSSICSLTNISDHKIGNHKLIELLGENIKVFSGDTDGYWKDLETNDKKYMIIKMENGNYVRSCGLTGGDLSSTDINGKFLILNGIDYKSVHANHQLLYMEV